MATVLIGETIVLVIKCPTCKNNEQKRKALKSIVTKYEFINKVDKVGGGKNRNVMWNFKLNG